MIAQSKPRPRLPKTALALLLLAVGLLIGTLIGQAIHSAPADHQSPHPGVSRTPSIADQVAADAKAKAQTDVPLSYLCIDGNTFVVRGVAGITRFPEKDSICAAKK